jgi:exonuclease SbcC
MRPVELTFSGLRSYRGEATIDFSSLELFAVIGDTGAGKSTIIEALSLVLYGAKTWSGGKLEQVIADGANGWAIRLRFEVGGTEWIVSRARRRSGAGINKLECPTTGAKYDGEADVTRQVTALLGLDHTQFLRAVVMPQGRFDELLRARSAERTKILSSIFGLEDLAKVRKQAETLRAAWKDELARASGRRAGLPVDPQDQLDSARQRLAERGATATALRAASQAAQRADSEAAGLERVVDRLTAAVGRVPDAAGDPVAALRQLADRAADLAARRQAAAGDRAAAEETTRRLEADRLTVLDGFTGRDAAVAAATAVRLAADALETALAGLAEAEAEAGRLTGSAPIEAVPTELLEREEQTAGLEQAALEQVEAARTALADARLAWATLVRARSDHDNAATALSTAGATVETARRDAEQAGAELAITTAALGAAKVAHSDAVRLERAAAAAAGCAPGDPCPVCRRTLSDDFTPPTVVGLADAERRLDDAEAHHRDAERNVSRADAALGAATAAHETARTRLAEASDLLRAAERTAASARLVLDTADEAVALQPLDTALAGAEAAARAAGDDARQAQQAVTSARHEIDSALALHRRRSDDARNAVTAARASVAGERRKTADLPPSWRPGPDHGPAELTGLLGQITAALTRLDGLDVQAGQARDRLDAATTALAAIETDRANEVTGPTNATIGAVRVRHDRVTEVVAALAGTDGDDLPPLAEPPAAGSDPAHAAGIAAAALEAHAAVLGEATRRLEHLRVRLDAAIGTRDEALTAAGFESLTTLDQATGAAEADARTAATDAERAAGTVETAARLDAFLAVAGPFVANLEVLVASLRDGKFIAHLVSRREAELTAEATRRLKAITKGRYGFVDGFGVVDLASGEVRTPDSLSGGERFQAALALALGLVEIASRGGGRLDAVFVDEGFGSLDANALDIALDTLGTVASGGKMVALISHLRPVADYVDTVLHVHKDDVFGSRITVLRGEERERFLDDEIRAGLTG